MREKKISIHSGSQILVRKVCGLGDMILTVPWLLALREVHPGSSLHMLCHSEQGELLSCWGIVDKAFPEEGSGWHGLFSDTEAEHCLKLRPDPLEYDHLYLFLAGSAMDLACALRARIGGSISILPPRPWASQLLHASLLPFKATGIIWEERFFEGLEQKPKPEDASFLVHPGSGSQLKNWPPENFAALMDEVSKTVPQAHWRVLEGPSDKEAVEALCRLWRGRLEVLRPGSLPALASSLQEYSLFIGNDSGVTHLAAFLGIPTLALFGPSDPRIWSPIGKKVRVACRQEACEACHLWPGKPNCQGPCKRFPSVSQALETLLYLGPFG